MQLRERSCFSLPFTEYSCRIMANRRKRKSMPGGLSLDESFKFPDVDDIPRRKRKRRHTEDDRLSIKSLDMNYKTPSKKKRRSLARLSSLLNIVSPVRPVKSIGSTLQKSLSLRNLVSPSNTSSANYNSAATTKYNGTPYKEPKPTKLCRRASTFWSDTIDGNLKQQFSIMAIERQEAIFELYKGEEDLVEDLKMVKTTYHYSLKKLQLMSDEELNEIFGYIDTLVPLHEDLKEQLQKERRPDGTTENIGQILLSWIPCLQCYVEYCSNQVKAKATLDRLKQDPAIDDFLQRCQESPFSRKLDLWSFLDVPRSKLVKYPILIKGILKKTPKDHEDVPLLNEAMKKMEDLITEVDRRTGEAKCEHIIKQFDYLEDKQKDKSIEESTYLLCEGILKSNRGTKLTAYLFNKVMVLTRPSSRTGVTRYQVYRQPIPIDDIVVEDLKDGEAKMGSFRNAFSQDKSGKHMFRVSFREAVKGQAHTLMANDEHDKKQWLTSLRKLMPAPPQLDLDSADV